MSTTLCVPLAALMMTAGCAHAVRVESHPPGAEVVLDGVKIGHTPVSFTDEGSTGHTYLVELEKPGYRERRVRLKQEVRGVRAGLSVIAGLAFAFPLLGLLWSWELPKERYVFRLEPDGSLPLQDYERDRLQGQGRRTGTTSVGSEEAAGEDALLRD